MIPASHLPSQPRQHSSRTASDTYPHLTRAFAPHPHPPLPLRRLRPAPEPTYPPIEPGAAPLAHPSNRDDSLSRSSSRQAEAQLPRRLAAQLLHHHSGRTRSVDDEDAAGAGAY